jgi:phospholipid/cholesterol/gamma-HCH transport system substrate-binding protein
MSKRYNEHFKLGVFVLIGLLGLVFVLYALGNKQNMFGRSVAVQAYFKNVSGLKAGNNVQFAGINIGTVRKLELVSDTAVLVTLDLEKKGTRYLKKNDIATIGSDGLMGNKILIILPGASGGAPLVGGDFLKTREPINMDEMMRTLDTTNQNVAVLSEKFREMVIRLSENEELWGLVEDPALPANIRSSLTNIKVASDRANLLMAEVQQMVSEVAQSEDGLLDLLKDTTITHDLRTASSNINALSNQLTEIGQTADKAVNQLANDLNQGKGPLNAILKDPQLTQALEESLKNVESGTDAFNQSMEALKNNFLFRRYFRKMEEKVD